MARIMPAELEVLLRTGAPATVLDVGTAERRAQTGWIPGSIQVHDVAELMLGRDDEIIVYCDCPNDASAAVTARRLKEQGYRRVRPLAGGVDAWRGGAADRSRGLKALQPISARWLREAHREP